MKPNLQKTLWNQAQGLSIVEELSRDRGEEENHWFGKIKRKSKDTMSRLDNSFAGLLKSQIKSMT